MSGNTKKVNENTQAAIEFLGFLLLGLAFSIFFLGLMGFFSHLLILVFIPIAIVGCLIAWVSGRLSSSSIRKDTSIKNSQRAELPASIKNQDQITLKEREEESDSVREVSCLEEVEATTEKVSTTINTPTVVPSVLTQPATSAPPQPSVLPLVLTPERAKIVKEEVLKIVEKHNGRRGAYIDVSSSGEITFFTQSKEFTFNPTWKNTPFETRQEGAERYDPFIRSVVEKINSQYPGAAEEKNTLIGNDNLHAYHYNCVISPTQVLRIFQELDKQKLQVAGDGVFRTLTS